MNRTKFNQSAPVQTGLSACADKLTWKANNLKQNAKIVFARALWSDIPKEEAIQEVLNHRVATLFEDEPHLLLSLWNEVATQIYTLEEPDHDARSV